MLDLIWFISWFIHANSTHCFEEAKTSSFLTSDFYSKILFPENSCFLTAFEIRLMSVATTANKSRLHSLETVTDAAVAHHSTLVSCIVTTPEQQQ